MENLLFDNMVGLVDGILRLARQPEETVVSAVVLFRMDCESHNVWISGFCDSQEFKTVSERAR